ncbi:MAG: hypothetical protein JW919_07255, partial [Candidatus Omnitrophica bacterium]|nr:hypothetical protein [Candidatus Omnitrophota bacterium]
MIDYYTDPRKRIWVKTISLFIVISFLWYDITWAGGDLFYSYTAPKPAQTSGSIPERLPPIAEKKGSKEVEVTNYDLLSYKERKSVVDSLLPSRQEKQQSWSFSPAFIQEQQQKHEAVVREKQEMEDLGWSLDDALKRKLQAPEDEDWPLQKRQSSDEGGAGGMGAAYTLTDPDDIEDAHNLNDYDYDVAGALEQIMKFDVTRRPEIDLAFWRDGSEKKTDEKTALPYWVGYKDKTMPGDERLIELIIYFGDKDSSKVEKIYAGYRLNPGTGEYEAKFRIDYTYAGEDITETKKYDVSDGTDRLIEKSTYAGTGDDNKIQETLYYKVTDPLNYYIRTKYTYDVDNKLISSATYTKKADGTEYLSSNTLYAGEKGKEIADYTQNFAEDGSVTDTTVYYYKGDKRAADGYYRDPKEKAVTYWGDIDADGDGIITDAEIAAGTKKSETFYDTEHRLNGEEVTDYTLNYSKAGLVTSKTIYYYAGGVTANDANYRDCLTETETYRVFYTDDDGDGIAETMNIGTLKSETFYHTDGRLKGEEVADYAYAYNSTGTKVTAKTVYIYEGGNTAATALATDLMERSDTYRTFYTDTDGDGINETLNIGTLKSQTFYNLIDSTGTKRDKGEEIADYTYAYDRTGTNVIAKTIYIYEGDKTADQADAADLMIRSDTYRIAGENPDGSPIIGTLKSQTFYSITNPDATERLKGEEVADYTYTYDRTGTRITSKTVYIYEGDKTADQSESTALMIESDTYRIFYTDDDGDGIAETMHVGTLKSSTFYSIYNPDGTKREKGEEVADYTYNYDKAGTNVTAKTIYIYEGEHRADQAECIDLMIHSDTYRVFYTDDDGDGVKETLNVGTLKSQTFYNIIDSDGVKRSKGEEVADYTYTYDNGGTRETSKTVYIYEGDKTADQAGPEDLMIRSDTYRIAGENPDGSPIIGTLKSETYYNIIDGTGLKREKGEEIADYSYAYDTAGTTVKNVSVFYYNAAFDRAADADPEDAMTESELYRTDSLANIDKDGVGADDNLTSATYYAGDKGEEIADYSYNYKLGDASIIKSTSVMYYGAAVARATAADPLDAMAKSESYKTDDVTKIERVVGDAVADNLLSETYFVGEKGDEIADYSYNFKLGDASIIKSTSVMYYGAGQIRATLADPLDAMTKSESYKTDDVTKIERVIGDATADNLLSETYFVGEKGDEIADYSYNFKLGDASIIKSTSVMYYGAGMARATAADPLDAMTKSESYKCADVADIERVVGDATAD